MPKENIYRIKVALKYSKPPIWRRIEVPGDTTLARLHQILQDTMGWYDCHLHHFIVGDRFYAPVYPDREDWELETLDESRVRLAKLSLREKSKFRYEYDFGDGWEHELLVEKISPLEEGVSYPRCIAGKRACPPEDVGGIFGYYDFLKAMNNRKHPRHKELCDWIGGSFDPDAFDREQVNERLDDPARWERLPWD